eukprot:TRINITY_DN9475_c0_g1_i1.p1 TRINITY_DN9475_c0_g1~~TRINITY_DN9475_c0_g1_i1.p1  ORF type:complete len:108 (-),score=1.58 TRINITY_DN9475_c0_g1_i1:102-425(-)
MQNKKGNMCEKIFENPRTGDEISNYLEINQLSEQNWTHNGDKKRYAKNNDRMRMCRLVSVMRRGEWERRDSLWKCQYNRDRLSFDFPRGQTNAMAKDKRYDGPRGRK